MPIASAAATGAAMGAGAGGVTDVAGVGRLVSGVATAAGNVTIRAIDEISEVLNEMDRPTFNYEISFKVGKNIHSIRFNISKLDIVVILLIGAAIYSAFKAHKDGESGSAKLIELLTPLRTSMAKGADALMDFVKEGAASGEAQAGAGQVAAAALGGPVGLAIYEMARGR